MKSKFEREHDCIEHENQITFIIDETFKMALKIHLLF